MRGDDDARPGFRRAFQQAGDDAPVVRVEGGRGLVGEDIGGFLVQGAGHSRPLFLAARQDERRLGLSPGEAHSLQDPVQAGVGARAAPQEPGRSERDVVGQGLLLDQPVVLVDESRFPAPEAPAYPIRGRVVPVHRNGAGAGALKQTQAVEQGGLAAARRADEGDHLAGSTRQGDAVQDPAAGDRHAEIGCFDAHVSCSFVGTYGEVSGVRRRRRRGGRPLSGRTGK